MSSKKTIRAGGVNEHFNLPWIKLSESNNQKAFELFWKAYAGGTGVLTSALKNSEIDIAVLLTEGLLLDILKTNELKLIAFHVDNPLRWGIHVRNEDTTGKINYSGKKFAVSRIGSGSHTMAKYLLSENNTPYSDENMIEVGSLEGGLESLANKTSDVFLWEKFTTEPFLSIHNLSCIGEIKTPWPPFSIAVRKSYYNENKNLLSEIILEVKKLADQILANKNTSQEIFERWKINTANAEKWLSEIRWNDRMLDDNFDFTPIFKNMQKAGLLDELPTLN